jgi:hypothetical protein
MFGPVDIVNLQLAGGSGCEASRDDFRGDHKSKNQTPRNADFDPRARSSKGLAKRHFVMQALTRAADRGVKVRIYLGLPA